MKKHVWILNHYASDQLADRGGRHYNFAKYLKREGYEPVLFCSNSEHGTGKRVIDTETLIVEARAEEIDVPFEFVKTRTYKSNGKDRVLCMLDFFFNVKKAALEYAKTHEKPDVIIASSVHPLTLIAGMSIAKKMDVDCICEVRDLWPASIVAYNKSIKETNPLIKFLYIGEKWIYKKARTIIFTMEDAYKYIEKKGWTESVPYSKIYYINNGVDLEQFRINREKYVTKDEDIDNEKLFKVVYTGSIRTANRIELLVDAASLLREEKDIKILIWGDGDEVDKISHMIEEKELNNIVLKGRTDKSHIPYITSKSDVNYLDIFDDEIAEYGISSNKLFEYFAAGKPILVNISNGHIPGEDSRCNVFYERSAEGIAEAILRVKTMNTEEYKKCCESAERVSEKYSFEALTKKLIEIIER